MSHLRVPDDDLSVPEVPGGIREPRKSAVYVEAAAFYVACLRAGYADEGQEFQEWFLDTFDIDLED